MNKLVFLFTFILNLQTNSSHIDHFTINPKKDKEVNFLLSEIADQVKYIKLETNEKCMVGWIKKLLFDGEYLFIASHQGAVSKLLMFSKNGNFIKEIGSTGRGPGEFSTVLDFTLNESEEIIYILDTMGKIFLYDYSGKYLSTIKLETKPTSILYFHDALFLFAAWPDYYLNKGYGLAIKQLTENKKDIYLLNRKQIQFQKVTGIAVYHNYVVGINSKKTIYLLEEKFDTLYNIDTDYNIKASLVLNLVDKVPRDLFTINDYDNAMRTSNTIFSFIVANDYLFFSVMTPDPSLYFYRLNITTGQVLKHNISKDKHYIINDIDGGISFKPEGLASEDNLYSILDCDVLKDNMDNAIQKRKLVNPMLADDLKKIVQNSEYIDNPIIMLVTLK